MNQLNKQPAFKREFKATKDSKGNYVVHALREQKANGDVIMHVPSMPLINKMIKEEKAKENGKRNLQ